MFTSGLYSIRLGEYLGMNVAAAANQANIRRKTIAPNSSSPLVDLNELVGNTQEKRNWRGIIIALLVILTVLALIVTAIILVTPRDDGVSVGKKLTFNSIMDNEYKPKVFHPIWQKGRDAFLYRSAEHVYEFDCELNSSSPLMDDSVFRVLATEHFQISPDKKYVLFKYDERPVYRHSTLARYNLYNFHTKKMTPLVGPDPMDPMNVDFQYVTWSPKDDHSLIFIQHNDLHYLKNLDSDNYIRFTYTGMENWGYVFNGIPDWVYEEEILESDNALWFSPDGTYLLYAVFNDTEVFLYDMPEYGELENMYINHVSFRYPKPGTPNPKVHLKILNLQTNVSRDIPPPFDFAHRDHYFTTVTWQNHNNVLITWLNRAQNKSIVTICSADTGNCKTNLRVGAEGGWLDMSKAAIFTPKGHHYFLLLPHKDGAAGSFQHIAMIDAKEDLGSKSGDGTKIFLTAGMWDARKIVGYDDSTKTIYFLATKSGDPTLRHLYSTTILKESPDFRQITCVSCDVSELCQYVDASFTHSGKYYILGCLGPGVPSYHLYSTEEGFMRTMEENEELGMNMENLLLPRTEYFNIPLQDGSSDTMLAKLLLPPVLKEEEIITYNVLFRVYGGPNTQMVTKEFKIDWEHYLSSTHSVIIAYVDGRGTSGRGNKWLHSNYKRLGTYEVDDTITAAKYFNKLSYVNTRTAIWGLSYGGFLTTAAISRGSDALKCGLAVAPVTDWRYYDSVYTERYMGFPTANDNLAAYNVANLSRYAAKFKSSKFMLIHGTADDNVHFQNSAQLIKALTEADVYFRTQIYTDENHFLNWGNTKTHLYNTMEEFVLQCFGKSPSPDGSNGGGSNDESEKDLD